MHSITKMHLRHSHRPDSSLCPMVPSALRQRENPTSLGSFRLQGRGAHQTPFIPLKRYIWERWRRGQQKGQKSKCWSRRIPVQYATQSITVMMFNIVCFRILSHTSCVFMHALLWFHQFDWSGAYTSDTTTMTLRRSCNQLADEMCVHLALSGYASNEKFIKRLQLKF